MLTASLWFTLVVALWTGCSVQSRGSSDRVFEFSSGGAYHFAGFGEWQVRLDGEGVFSVEHNVRGEINDYGSFELTKGERAELWGLIDVADVGGLESSQRAGVPDEVQYTFALRERGRVHEMRIWANDARENEGLMTLIDEIGGIIEKYTGESVVLR
jgi:hypothetical protein